MHTSRSGCQRADAVWLPPGAWSRSEDEARNSSFASSRIGASRRITAICWRNREATGGHPQKTVFISAGGSEHSKTTGCAPT